MPLVLLICDTVTRGCCPVAGVLFCWSLEYNQLGALGTGFPTR
jgi:hypothetical protein